MIYLESFYILDMISHIILYGHEFSIISSRNEITEHSNVTKDFIDFQTIADLNGKHHLSLFTK